MTEQWQELKETIIEMRDNDGTGTQQDVCKFLANYMEVLEKQMQEPMRDATEEERKSVKDYVESISKPTGVRFDAQLTDITWVVGNDGAQVAFKNMPVDKAQQICAIIGDEAQSTDAVSRTLVHEAITASIAESENPYEMWQRIEALPPVKPKYTDEEIDKAQAVEQAYVDKMVELAVEETKRPKGKWIHREDMDYLDKNKVMHIHFMCQDCGFIHDFIDGHTAQYKFCPNCGAEMSGGETDADKEG